MSTPNFAAILDQPVSETSRPKPLPAGSYICVVEGLPEQDVSAKKKTPYVRFTLRPLQAQDDVDADALNDQGGFGSRTFKATYYVTEDAKWRLKKFLEDLQIDDEGEDKTFSQMISESPGRQVIAYVKHRASEDGEAVYAEVNGTAAVE